MSYAAYGDAITDAITPYVTTFADGAYNKLRSDFERDADAWVAAMKPYLQDAVKEMFTDAALQKSLNDTKIQIVVALGATAAAAAVGSWLLLRK